MPRALTIPSNSRSVIFLVGPYATKGHAVITVACNASGNVYPVVIGGTVSASGGTNSLTLTDISGTISNVLAITYSGDRITA